MSLCSRIDCRKVEVEVTEVGGKLRMEWTQGELARAVTTGEFHEE
jgi:hypothetical protein